MTEPLNGIEGLRAALECPEEWEAQNELGKWCAYPIWQQWGVVAIRSCDAKFRRIEKPREAMVFNTCTRLIYGNPSGARLHVELPSWEPNTLVHVRIRELLADAPEEPDWKEKYQSLDASHEVLKGRLGHFETAYKFERAAHEETKAEAIEARAHWKEEHDNAAELTKEIYALKRTRDAYLEESNRRLKRAEVAEAKLKELHMAANNMLWLFTGGSIVELRRSLTRCAPEGKTDG